MSLQHWRMYNNECKRNVTEHQKTSNILPWKLQTAWEIKNMII